MQTKSKESTSKNKKEQIDNSNKEFTKHVNIFETTYERVLSIINQVKEFIKKTSKTSQKLIDDLEWVIKVITNKSLYSYEVTQPKNIKRNSDINRLINFMTQYNDEILELNKRHILVSSIFNIIKKKDILLKPSLILKKIHPDELKNMDFQKEKEIKERKKKSINIIGNIFLNLYYKGLEQQKKEKEEKEKAEKEKVEKEKPKKEKKEENDKKSKKFNSEKREKVEKYAKTREEKKDNIKIEVDLSKKFKNNNKKESKPKIPYNHIIKNHSISINTPQKVRIKKLNTTKMNLNKISINDSDKKRSIEIKKKIKNKLNDSNNFNNSKKENNLTQILNKKLTLTSIKKAMHNYYNTHKDLLGNNNKRPNKSINTEKEFLTDKNIKTNYLSESNLNNNLKPKEVNKKPNYRKINNNINKKIKSNKTEKIEERLSINTLIDKYSNDIRNITDKDFCIFDFKKKVGYGRVLPIIGHVLLKTLGLIDSRIISISKLNSFLYSVSEGYLETTLYHNAMHGADVAQSLCIFFISTNAEQISETTVLDLLGMIISAMGHDLGHPGYTNNFHINALTDLALTYNDASCLENFHTSYLFKILKKEENNIFEKFSIQDFKTIRKRMISQILATDMANHGEVVSLIRAKIKSSEEEGEGNFELLSGNEKSKFDEQQMLFNYLTHAADLGHNCKKFDISLQWVEVLCEEFWKQGDMEKKKGIPVSFLCDRDNIDVPTSQVGFLRGFIVTTFDCLVAMFPTLKYTMENAENNIKQWQNLRDKNRMRGWTPKKEEKEEKKKN